MAQSDSLEALSLFAEAAQDLVTAGLEEALGRNFACADACNQVAEKALQAVHIVRSGHRAPYNHDLRALGETVNVPAEVSTAIDALSRYHPETYHAHTAPEEADDQVTPEEVRACMQNARLALRWARSIVMGEQP